MSKFIETKYATLDAEKVSYVSKVDFNGDLFNFEIVIEGCNIHNAYCDLNEAEWDRKKIVDAIV